jgi:hypothetical protein
MRIKRSYIAGAGVSGALLAGAAIVFISLVGLVSFHLWPQSRDGADALVAELDLAPSDDTPGGSVAEPSSTSSPPLAPQATGVGPGPGPTGAKGGNQNAGKHGNPGKGAKAAKGGTQATVVPPATTSPGPSAPQRATPPARSGNGGGSSAASGGATRGGSSSGHPSHPKHSKHSTSKHSTSKHSANGHGRGGRGNGYSPGSGPHGK